MSKHEAPAQFSKTVSSLFDDANRFKRIANPGERAPDPYSMTFLQTLRPSRGAVAASTGNTQAGKIITFDGDTAPKSARNAMSGVYHCYEARATNLEEAAKLFEGIAKQGDAFFIKGRRNAVPIPSKVPFPRKGKTPYLKSVANDEVVARGEYFDDEPKFLIPLDGDGFELPTTDPIKAMELIREHLGYPWRNAALLGHLSSSHGIKNGWRLHLFGWASRPLNAAESQAIGEQFTNLKLDSSLKGVVQPFFFADPYFRERKDGKLVRLPDRIEQRWFYLDGGYVIVPDDFKVKAAAKQERRLSSRFQNEQEANDCADAPHMIRFFVDELRRTASASWIKNFGGRHKRIIGLSNDAGDLGITVQTRTQIFYTLAGLGKAEGAALVDCLQECGLEDAEAVAEKVAGLYQSNKDAWDYSQDDKSKKAPLTTDEIDERIDYAEACRTNAFGCDYQTEAELAEEAARKDAERDKVTELFGFEDDDMSDESGEVAPDMTETVAPATTKAASNEVAPDMSTEQAVNATPADTAPLLKALNFLRQTIELERPESDVTIDANRVKAEAFALGDLEAADLADSILCDIAMGDDFTIYEGSFDDARERLAPGSAPLGTDVNAQVKRLPELVKGKDFKAERFNREAEIVRALVKGIDGAPRRVNDALVAYKSGLKVEANRHKFNEAYHHLEVLTRDAANPTSITLMRGYDTLAEIDALNERVDLIEDLFGLDNIGLTYAEPGAKKTFMALDFAAHIATGTPWKVGDRLRKVEQGAVAYFALEGGSGVKDRVLALMERHPSLKTCDLFNYQVCDVFLRDGGEAAVIAACKELSKRLGRPISLVVIDTLADATVGFDENSTKDMNEIFGKLKAIQAATKAHVHLVHHAGKDASKGARGSSVAKGKLDTVIRLEPGEGASVIATVEKQRDREKECFAFTTRSVHVRTNRADKEVYSLVVDSYAPAEPPSKGGKSKAGLSENQRKTLAAVVELHSATGKPVQVKDIADAAGLTRDATNNALDALRAADRLLKTGRGAWAPVAPGAAADDPTEDFETPEEA